MDRNATADQIRIVYRALLEREPDPTGLQGFLGSDVDDVIRAVRGSPEAQTLRRGSQAQASSPFFHFNARVDVAAIVKSHEDTSRVSIPGRLVNFLGVIIDPAFLPSLLEGRQGEIEGIPIPANWHADMAEFAAALRAVDLAINSFRMIELGCGWGCWLLNTGVAARRRGLSVDLIGAEGDAGHVKFARQGCVENGFQASQANIYQRVVGPRPGTAMFPKQDRPGEMWGLEAIFDPNDEQLQNAKQGGRYDILQVVTLEAVMDLSGR